MWGESHDKDAALQENLFTVQHNLMNSIMPKAQVEMLVHACITAT